MANKHDLIITARAEEELHTNQKLTNQLFDDSLNASATFVAVVSRYHLIYINFVHFVFVACRSCYLPLDIP